MNWFLWSLLKSFELIEYVVNLSQMAYLVTTYLSSKAKPNASYVAVEEDENGGDKVMFKRLKMSNEENLAWENFIDFGSSLPPGSSERRRLVSQLMSSFHITIHTCMRNSDESVVVKNNHTFVLRLTASAFVVFLTVWTLT